MPELQQIKRFILENFLFSDDDNALAAGDSLIRGGVIDSTGIAELITYIEEQFGIQVEPAEMVPANFETLECVDAFVARKLAA